MSNENKFHIAKKKPFDSPNEIMDMFPHQVIIK